jgi:hypothetical protein
LHALRDANGDNIVVVHSLKQAAEASVHTVDKTLLCELQRELSGRRAQGQNSHAYLAEAQRHLDTLIVRAAAPLRGMALKDFIKALWPDSEQRIANSRRLFSLDLQSEFAGHSKRLRRDARMPSRLDIGAPLEQALDFLRRTGLVKGEPAPTDKRMSAQGLSWMATRLKHASGQRQALEKARDAYERMQDKNASEGQRELADALRVIVEGMGNLKTHALRTEARQLVERHLPELTNATERVELCSLLCQAVIDEVRALRISSSLEDQQAALTNVKAMMKHADDMRVETRAAMAQALAQAFSTRMSLNAEFSLARTYFVDDAVRRQMEESYVMPDGFDRNKLVVDFGRITPAGKKRSAEGKGHTREGNRPIVDGVMNYTKSIRYRNVRAAEEVLMTRILALTGMDCPSIRLGQNAQEHFSFNEKNRNDYREHKDNPGRFAVVTSEIVLDFQELGPLVLDGKQMLPLIRASRGEGGVATYKAALKKYKRAVAAEKKLDRKQPEDTDENDPVTRAKQKARNDQFEAMQQIYAMWPDRLKNLSVKMLYMSRGIADKDFLNFAWKNFGFRHPAKDPESWRPFALDEGNAGTAGFGGMQVQNSFERMNRRARLDDAKKPNKMLRSEAVFNGEVGHSRSGAASIPRHVPSLPLVADLVRAETRMWDVQGGYSKLPEHEKRHFEGCLEAAYQLSFLPYDALLHVARESWPYGEPEFTPTDGDEPMRSPEDYAWTLKERFDNLVDKFTPEELAEWAGKNPGRAQAAYADISAAVAAMTGICVAPRVQQGAAAATA